jgi:anti-sigma28 factor (negative regulator of flagellin synthesis)
MQKLNSIEQLAFDEALINAKKFKASEILVINSLQRADELGYFKKLGYSSLSDFAQRALKLSPDVSYIFISIARKSKKVPELKSAIESGDVTVSNARLISSVITPENKEHWLSLAAELPKPKLEREIAKVSPQKAVQEKVQYVSESQLKATLSLSEKAYEILKRVQDLESQKTRKAASFDEAVIAMGEAYLKKEDPLEKAKRNHSSRGRVQSQYIPFQRNPIRANTEHFINLRDQRRCTHHYQDGKRCENRRWLEIHHKIPISHGGTNDPQNLTTLCHAHHRAGHS